MKRSLLVVAALWLFPACTIGHRVGENHQMLGAISCALTTCNGTAVCVDSACVEPTGMCGGFAGIQCAAGQRCVDEPRDGCDPSQGDADCGGVCVPGPTTGGHDGGTDGGTPPPDGGMPPMSCGGFRPNPPMCPSGYKCVDNPNGCSMAVDCPGICVVDTGVILQCGGRSPNPHFCATGEVCIDNPTTGSMAVDHLGICIKKVFCGGFGGIACPGNLSCVDDPSDSCDPNNGGADCGGMCVLTQSHQCGGFAGLPCPSGLRCLDDPADNCDPNSGNFDCGGLCVP